MFHWPHLLFLSLLPVFHVPDLTQSVPPLASTQDVRCSCWWRFHLQFGQVPHHYFFTKVDGFAHVPCPVFLSAVVLRGFFWSKFYRWMPFPMPASRCHSLCLIFIHYAPEHGGASSSFTSAHRLHYRCMQSCDIVITEDLSKLVF